MKRFLIGLGSLALSYRLYRLLFSGYSNTGPFTNNVVPPGISATFLNNVENFLDTVNSAATDSHVTADGNGNVVTTGTVQVANNKAYQSKDSGGTVRSLMTLDGSNNLIVKAGGNNQIRLQTSSGAEQARIDGTGLNLIAGTFSLLTGSIARISMFSGTATVTATLFNHGLGAVPDIVLLQLTIASSTAHMLTYYNDGSLSSSQVKVQS